MANGIQHVFVLMLENRSFDHMLGFSGITGTDAVSGGQTEVMGLIDLDLVRLAKALNVNTASSMAQKKGKVWPPPPAISVRDLFVANEFNGQTYRARQPAYFGMLVLVDPGSKFAGPGHEFADVLLQLCGPDGEDAYLAALSNFNAGGAAPQYPQMENSGFVASYEAAMSNDGASLSPGQIMQCYINQSQLPVLSQLAQQFVICDNWYSSLPGPTWPNRFFVHAASSGGLDHSPSDAEMANWELVSGFSFKNGTIFERMNSNNVTWRIYAGDNLPIVAALSGINVLTDINDYNGFAQDVSQPNYPASYTFIEPNYGDSTGGTFECGTSQHPLDDVTRGEALIKATYEAIRNSPVWSSSLLIITWDEHGGFFDHMPPPIAVPPGDTAPGSSYNLYGFSFNRYGPRVPALVISPLIPRNLIDHRVYDHASIPATVEALFGLKSMTQRDASALNLVPLITLAIPRNDAPAVLSAPAQSGLTNCAPVSFDSSVAKEKALVGRRSVSRPEDSINEGNLPGFLLVAMRSDMALSSSSEERRAIISRVRTIRTRAQASEYMEEVGEKVQAVRNAYRKS